MNMFPLKGEVNSNAGHILGGTISRRFLRPVFGVFGRPPTSRSTLHRSRTKFHEMTSKDEYEISNYELSAPGYAMMQEGSRRM